MKTCTKPDCDRPFRAKGLCMICYQNDHTQRIRMDWILEQGGHCVKCWSTDNLEVDHMDKSTKKLKPASLWNLSKDNPKRVAELEKCQVLCHACHKAKSSKEKTKEKNHGTRRAYSKAFCRCDSCKKANSLIKRIYRSTGSEAGLQDVHWTELERIIESL